ncbi:putative arabinan endo-1,5-alpha-L-arabinosidase A [Cytospora mali]|uniref:Arabinan endo-1,5-alpha-L-arabinosidase n=1 Tax=Cytospora mali TaxID=578113 RepID=A0A194V6Y0_CYTMA|nr:putative arabinan endo-1,5-alpha-L-arabinosidase A [Valsa mali var. pyri (nom. inval.)]
MFTLSKLAKGLAALALTILPAVQAAYPSPGACSGACWAHDPAVVKRTSDGVYFRFNTGSEIGIYKSSSLSGPWTFEGAAIPGGSSIDIAGNTDLWAPDVHYIDGTYYMYYAVSSFGTQTSAIGYATSKTMEYGSWTDHGATGISSKSGKNYNAIDPNLIQATDGTYYMNFGSFWNDIFQVEMSSVSRASSAAYNIAFNASGTHAMEGSFIYYRAPYYYLFFSSGICCGYDTSKPASGAEYSIRVCRSESVSGSYVDEKGVACLESGGSTVLASHGTVYGPGGQGVFADTKEGGAVLYYHYADTSVGIADADYKFGWNTISWSTGWPVLQ